LKISKSEETSNNNIYFDAIAFNSDSLNKERIDCFVVIPYSALKFKSLKNKYFADINLIFDLQSENGESLTKQIEKKIVTEDYFESQGGNGGSKIIIERFHVKPGNYTIKINITNEDNSLTLRQGISIIDFSSKKLTLSGLMLLSSIEESSSGLKISPYFSDNVAKLESDFFSFFEVYNNSNSSKNLKFAYHLINKDNNIKYESDLFEKKIRKGTNQDFLLIKNDIDLAGKLILRVYVLEPSAKNLEDKSKIITASERVINFTDQDFADLFKDIDLSIRQLRYVAKMETIDEIQEIKSTKEKKERFQAFWKVRDPTPRTSINEAMDEYYRRVAFANANFKSYADGWLTDMGMVFITLGKPDNINRDNQNMTNNITYERWSYSNGRNYIFEDRTGFGDFRLIRPMGFNEKYEYNR
jgi:GWxTD domain-containing protein